jgi:phospholipid transport system substrate-binding protein
LTDLLTDLLASGYSRRFPAFSNQKFENGSSTPIIPDRMIIESEFQNGSKIIKLDYQLIEIDGQWKIFDVVAEGVSDLALKRGSFAETFLAEGVEGVIRDIKQAIIDNARE